MIARTITIGLNKKDIFSNTVVKDIRSLFSLIKNYTESENLIIRTKRISIPIIKLDDSIDFWDLIDRVSRICSQINFRWFCLPLDISDYTLEESDELIPSKILSKYPSCFINIILTKNRNVDFNKIFYSAKFIKSISKNSNGGFGNFRYGVSCNVKANGPYFPFTFQEGRSGFSVAIETSEVISRHLENQKVSSIDIFKNEITEVLIKNILIFDKIFRQIGNESYFNYNGVDTSIAPFPNKYDSVSNIMKKLGIRGFGGHGTLFLTSVLTDILKSIERSEIKTVGFNGVMFSLLEDKGIGRDNELKRFSIDSLLLYSALCGCGFDMVPVPGDTTVSNIASLILDVFTMAHCLDKPLGVRILPIPSKSVNDITEFDHEFINNSIVQRVNDYNFNSEIFLDNKYCFSNRIDSKK